MKFRIIGSLLILIVVVAWFIQFNWEDDSHKGNSQSQSNQQPSRNVDAIRGLKVN